MLQPYRTCFCFKKQNQIIDWLLGHNCFWIILISLISCQVELHVLALANVGIGEERVARKMVHKAMVQVCYLSIRTLNGIA